MKQRYEQIQLTVRSKRVKFVLWAISWRTLLYSGNRIGQQGQASISNRYMCMCVYINTHCEASWENSSQLTSSLCRIQSKTFEWNNGVSDIYMNFKVKATKLISYTPLLPDMKSHASWRGFLLLFPSACQLHSYFKLCRTTHSVLVLWRLGMTFGTSYRDAERRSQYYINDNTT